MSTLSPTHPRPAHSADRTPKAAASGSVMRKVSLRSLSAHKVRLVLTVLSVVLGTAFVTGSFVFTDTLKATFNTLFADAAKGVDVVVTAHDERSAGVPTNRISAIQSVPGVRKVVAQVSGQVVLVGANGKATQGGGAPSIGQAYLPPAQALGDPFTFVAGHAPTQPNEIALNSGAVKLSKLTLGAHTKVVIPTRGAVDVVLSGIYSTKQETGGFIGALFTEQQALNYFTDGQHVAEVDIAGDGTVGQGTLRDRVAQAVPELKSLTGAQVRADTKKQIGAALSFVNYFLLAFGAIALLVGTFIIYNTFSMIVAQRLRELALLRAIGASRRQISRSVLGEALIVGLIGSVLGIAGGVGLAYGLRAILNALNAGLPNGTLTLQVRTVIVALLVGTVVTAISAYAPARRASKIPPVAAMREEFASVGASLVRRTIIAACFAALGALALLGGAITSGGGTAALLVAVGALLMILAVLLGAPALAGPVVGVLGVITRPFGAIGRLARTNAVRNPRRTAATAFALTLGLMLVSAIAVFGSSAKLSINNLVDSSVRADYILTGPDSIGVPAGAEAAARKVAGVKSAVALHPVQVKIDGKAAAGTGVDGPLADVAAMTLRSGSATLSGNDLLISQTTAKDRRWGLGAAVSMISYDGKTAVAHVTGIYADDQLLGAWLTTGEFYRSVTATSNYLNEVVLVKAAAGTNVSALRGSLETATDPFLVVQVQDRVQFKGTQAKRINSLLAILYGLLALAIVIAVLGIVNTLALSVVERRREIGMLRAVGMIRSQLRRAIYLESALIALFGAVIGVGMGLTFGALFVRTLRDQGLKSIAVPWGQSLTFLVVSALVGVLAAVWPAFRAARTGPLQAIAAD